MLGFDSILIHWIQKSLFRPANIPIGGTVSLLFNFKFSFHVYSLRLPAQERQKKMASRCGISVASDIRYLKLLSGSGSKIKVKSTVGFARFARFLLCFTKGCASTRGASASPKVSRSGLRARASRSSSEKQITSGEARPSVMPRITYLTSGKGKEGL